jgi:hypothetical protein
MKTVAAISFRDNHSLSMDIEGVTRIESSLPVQIDDGTWCCELLVRTITGTVALQLTADSADQLQVHVPVLE